MAFLKTFPHRGHGKSASEDPWLFTSDLLLIPGLANHLSPVYFLYLFLCENHVCSKKDLVFQIEEHLLYPFVFFFTPPAESRTGSSATATTSCWASFVPRSSRSSCLPRIFSPPLCLCDAMLRQRDGIGKGTLDRTAEQRDVDISKTWMNIQWDTHSDIWYM